MSVLNKALLAHAGEKCLNVSEGTASLHVVLGYEALGYGLHVQPLLHAVSDDGRGLVELDHAMEVSAGVTGGDDHGLAGDVSHNKALLNPHGNSFHHC